MSKTKVQKSHYTVPLRRFLLPHIYIYKLWGLFARGLCIGAGQSGAGGVA
jgi:hypothetical protein